MMKKLMIAMAAVAMVSAAKAEATYNMTAYNLGSAYNGYEISAQKWGAGILKNYDDQAKDDFNSYFLSDAMWSAFGVNTWKDYYDNLSGMLGQQGTVVNGSGTYTYTDPDDDSSFTQYSVVFGLFENGITAGSKYMLFKTVYYEGDTKTFSPTFDMTGATVLQSGTLKSDTVPEPTSGLLMLLGMAGLCLRRKQK